ncbi:MAG: hypothetical protein DMG76_35285 [Acidobacteria bacterium]|nr:MAG: hypothetical protein DMG76_35285 [Acidobacteriota bacterium]
MNSRQLSALIVAATFWAAPAVSADPEPAAKPPGGLPRKAQADRKKGASPMSTAPAPKSGSMPKGPAPKGKLGTEPTARGKLGTDPQPGDLDLEGGRAMKAFGATAFPTAAAALLLFLPEPSY